MNKIPRPGEAEARAAPHEPAVVQTDFPRFRWRQKVELAEPEASEDRFWEQDPVIGEAGVLDGGDFSSERMTAKVREAVTLAAVAQMARALETILLRVDPEALSVEVLPTYHPAWALDAFVPLSLAQDMHANLGELYPVWVQRHGLRNASRILRLQVAILIAGTWWEKALSTGERLLKSFRIIGS